VDLLLLAFEAAIYPTLLAAVVLLLGQPRPVRLLGAYLAGGMIISVGLGLAIVAALQDSHAVGGSRSAPSWIADVVVGGLAVLVAVVLATRADVRLKARRAGHRAPPPPAHEDREPWSQRILARGSVPLVFVAGLLINVPGAAYLIALKDIAAGKHPTGVVVAQVLLFNLIMFLLAEIPLVGLLVAPERTGALVARLDAWVSAHSRQIAAAVSGAIGVFLVARGIVHAS
jgi:hypothetical protein